jgi:D-glycero-D-manno-heptose 1,7-bisphosphate phosphatase
MKAIILDRDGVINFDSEHYIKSPEEWHAIPESLEAIATLNRHGYTVFVITNQSGIARGFYDAETLQKIHQKFLQELADVSGHVEEILFCPHHPKDHCACRKPEPALVYQLRDKYALTLADTYFIGDSWSDMEVSQKSGCKPLLVLTGNGEHTLKKHTKYQTIPHFKNLAEAVHFVLSRSYE